LLAFLPDVDRRARVGELHDHAAGAVRAAPEIDGANRAFCRRTRGGGGGTRSDGLADVGAGLLTQPQATMILSNLTPAITNLVHKLLDAGLTLGNQASSWASFASSWMSHDH